MYFCHYLPLLNKLRVPSLPPFISYISCMYFCHAYVRFVDTRYVQRNLWNKDTLCSEDTLWNKDTTAGPKMIVWEIFTPWNEDTSEIGTLVAFPNTATVSVFYRFDCIKRRFWLGFITLSHEDGRNVSDWPRVNILWTKIAHTKRRNNTENVFQQILFINIKPSKQTQQFQYFWKNCHASLKLINMSIVPIWKEWSFSQNGLHAGI
jgi:hypothetical protein